MDGLHHWVTSNSMSSHVVFVNYYKNEFLLSDVIKGFIHLSHDGKKRHSATAEYQATIDYLIATGA